MKKCFVVFITIILMLAMSVPAYAALQKGSKGEDVVALQERLVELGYLEGSIDGIFGNMTKAAMEAFQAANGLSITGTATIKDINVLFSESAIPFDAPIAKTEEVTANNDSDDSAFASFIEGYEKAEFEKYNSFASENGLGDTRIYLHCTLDKTEVLSADDTESLLGYITDDGGNIWLAQLHVIPIVSKSSFESYIGKPLIMRGVYSGYSAVKEMPVFVLDELLVKETGETANGMQKLLDE